MTPKKFPSKAVWAVSVAVILVALFLAVFFLKQTPNSKQESITLPPTTVGAPPVTSNNASGENTISQNFLEVTNDNVLLAIQNISHPSSYHQTYSVSVGGDDIQAIRTVDLWVNGEIVQAEVSDGNQIKSFLTDGTIVYLWYEGDASAISFRLDAETTIEDLLGLPMSVFLSNIPANSIVDSGYLVLEDPKVQCIYMCTQESSELTNRYWLNLENGLLYQSDVLENSNQVYVVRQTMYEVLAQEDEAFDNRFRLPDGSDPFIAEIEMPQP